MSGIVQWICAELSKLLGTDVNEDVAKYLLSIENATELEEYMGEILDLSSIENKAFVAELLNRRWQTPVDKSVSSKQLHSNSMALSKKENLKECTNDRSVKVGSFNKNSKQKLPMGDDGVRCKKTADSSVGNGAITDNGSQRRTSQENAKASKTKFVPLFSPEGHDRTVALIPGRHVCECQASKHALVNNCLGCGRVVCEQEGSGPCFFCRTLVCNKNEQEVLMRNSKKSDRLRDQLMKQTFESSTCDVDNISLNSAVAFKDRLLEYDRSSAKRTHVVDDESDYYSTDTNQWLRPKERQTLQQKKDDLHSRRHASRRDNKVTFDFAGRRIIEQRDTVESHVPSEVDGSLGVEVQSQLNPEDFQDDLVNPSLRVPPPKFTDNTPTLRNSYAIAVRGIKNVRLQDSDLQVMSDEGFALSMHQPWASLLVAGIKQHEGRSWYTTHRGILWIASTAKKPDQQEIKEMEAFYRNYYADQNLEFPSAYPSGCLLGCVNVEDCLERTEYTEQYPSGESESPYVFICKNPRELLVKFPLQGKHKIYKLDKHVHQAAKKGLCQ